MDIQEYTCTCKHAHRSLLESSKPPVRTHLEYVVKMGPKLGGEHQSLFETHLERKKRGHSVKDYVKEVASHYKGPSSDGEIGPTHHGPAALAHLAHHSSHLLSLQSKLVSKKRPSRQTLCKHCTHTLTVLGKEKANRSCLEQGGIPRACILSLSKAMGPSARL